jgi:beta-1,4-N-acetylglucosaminyltransferase
MIAMLKNLDSTLYNHRSYVVSAGDKFSAIKARDFEENLQKKGKGNTNLEEASKNILGQYGSYDIVMVPRARKIHQSLLTTPFSALQCLFACISVVRGPSVSGTGLTFPDLILTNGPGTGVCVIAAAYLLRILGLCGSDGGMRSIYVESWARVSSLSLSGKILIMFVDRFFVQWEKLKGIGGRAEYIGVLV